MKLKEIIQTLLTVAPFVVAIFGWAAHIESSNATTATEIVNLKQQRSEISVKLDAIAARLNDVGNDVAKLNGRLERK